MDKKNKTVFFAVLGACAVLLTSVSVFFGIHLQTALIAKSRVLKETQALKAENENLDNKRSILRKDLNSKDDNTKQKDELNKKITETSTEIKKLSEDISQKNSEILKLRQDSSAFSEEVTALNKGMNEKTASVSSHKNEILFCPNDLAEGRYKASGSGSITVDDIDGSAHISEDLGSVETGSYIFEIEAGESLEIDGEVKLARLS